MKSVASRENIITVSLSRTFYYPLASLHWRWRRQQRSLPLFNSFGYSHHHHRRLLRVVKSEVPFNFVISQILTPLVQTFNEWVSRCNAAATSTFSRLLISRANFSFVVSIPSRFSILALAWDKPHLTSVTWQSIILHKENSSIPFQVQVWEEHPLTPSSIPRPLLLHLCIISEMEKKEIRTLRHTHSSSRRVGI